MVSRKSHRNTVVALYFRDNSIGIGRLELKGPDLPKTLIAGYTL